MIARPPIPNASRGPARQAPDDGPGPGGPGGGKSADAFRTISEVSDEIDVPQHVLRFWETKFPQIKPLKRGGGRRYYRPEDIQLLRRIRHWLYVEGYTIRGVQRLLKEGGARLTEVAEGTTGGDNAPARAGASDAPGASAAGSADRELVEELRIVLDDLRAIRTELRRRLG